MSIARNIINMINVNEAGKKKPKISEEERERRARETELELQLNRDRTSMERYLKSIRGILHPSGSSMKIEIKNSSDMDGVLELYNTFKTKYPISIYADDVRKYILNTID